MFGLGLGDRARTSSPRRGPRVDWQRVAPYGLTLIATLVLGWALSQLG